MFEIAIRHRGPETVLVLSGDLDTAASMDLDAHIEQLVPTLEGPLTVDVGGLTYLNSTGIRSFIRLDKLLKERGSSFRLCEVSSRIFRIFSYCGLDAYFTMERRVEKPTRLGTTELAMPLPTDLLAAEVTQGD